jgi:hypothetical protein
VIENRLEEFVLVEEFEGSPVNINEKDLETMSTEVTV